MLSLQNISVTAQTASNGLLYACIVTNNLGYSKYMFASISLAPVMHSRDALKQYWRIVIL